MTALLPLPWVPLALPEARPPDPIDPAGLIDLRPARGFRLIMADPPWRFEARGADGLGKAPQRHYECLDVRAIAALPIETVAARSAILWLWATGPMLPEALWLMRAWGFTFKTMGWWSKRGASGKLAFGTGYILRSAGEPFLIGTRGQPRTLSRSVRNTIEGPRREHSRKPEEAYAAAEALVGAEAPRLDLFTRQSRPGWCSWGNEATLFDEATT